MSLFELTTDDKDQSFDPKHLQYLPFHSFEALFEQICQLQFFCLNQVKMSFFVLSIMMMMRMYKDCHAFVIGTQLPKYRIKNVVIM